MTLPALATAILIAAALAHVAYRAGALTRGGSMAAVGIGALSVAAGWSWAGLLVLFFVAGTVVSRLGAGLKERRAAGIVARMGARDARQVLANGGIFALCAVAYLLHPATLWWWTAAGALSAAAADTFSTEIGTLWSSSARSILTGERVPAGTSGGVSSPGTLAGVFGALLVAAAASAAAGSGLVAVTALTLAGVAGSIADSLLGATVQHRRWCGTCETFTERETHSCGTRTVHAGGIRWLDNDAVNLMATLTGGAAGALFATLWGA